MKNFTTSILATKTVLEVIGVLARAGAQDIGARYDDTMQPVAVAFTLTVHGQKMPFVLRVNVDGVLVALKRDSRAPRSRCNAMHARNVGWRVLKDWIEAQLALIEAGVGDAHTVFAGFLSWRKGQTLGDALASAPAGLLAELDHLCLPESSVVR